MILLLTAILLAVLWPRAVATILGWLIFLALVGGIAIAIIVAVASHFA
jgi:hypothetical protein